MTVLTRRGTVLGLLLAAGIIGLLTSAQPWFRVRDGASGGASGESAIVFTGAEASGGLTQALAAVVLAGVLLTLVLKVRGRRVVAVLLTACGLGMLLIGVLRSPPGETAVRTRFRQVSLADEFVLDGTGWPWAYAVAGLLVLAGAALLWIGCPGWAARGRRYEQPGTDPLADPDDPTGAWHALDAGRDPTVGSAAGHESVPGSDPDVRSPDTTDTMASGENQSSRRQNGDQ